MDCSWKKPKGTKSKYIRTSVSNRPNESESSYILARIGFSARISFLARNGFLAKMFFDHDDRVGIHNLDKLGGNHIRIIAVFS
jgi:hypothetical protein